MVSRLLSILLTWESAEEIEGQDWVPLGVFFPQEGGEDGGGEVSKNR